MKRQRQTDLPEKIENVLFRIQRGLVGYMSYLAACDMNEAFSEYLLYEPILRILLSQGFKVDGEAIAPRVKQPRRGDKKRLDFLIESPFPQFAIEVKWASPEPKTKGSGDLFFDPMTGRSQFGLMPLGNPRSLIPSAPLTPASSLLGWRSGSGRRDRAWSAVGRRGSSRWGPAPACSAWLGPK
jgi:hypothetical protein